MKLKNVFVVTYTFIYNGVRTNSSGPAIPLMDFFKKHTNKLYFLEQPLPGSDFMDTQFTTFYLGMQTSIKKINFIFSRLDPQKLRYVVKAAKTKTYIRLKLRDIFSNFYFFLRNLNQIRDEKIDLYIGVECINAFCGIFLKKIGLVKIVVYYVFDWIPYRYKNPIMGWLYIWLDRFATYNADYSWNITYKIAEGREKLFKFDRKKMSPQLYVPYSISLISNKVLPVDKIDKNLIIYSGYMTDINGPMLAIEAFDKVVKKFPKAKLLMIGGGEQENELIKYIKINNLSKHITMVGYIADQNKVIDLQCKGIIGLAPYRHMKESGKFYGDVIKIRMYFACGLVVISTDVPPVSKEIKEENLGIVVKNDRADNFADAIIELLENRKKLSIMRTNVVKKAKDSSWEKTYMKTLRRMEMIN